MAKKTINNVCRGCGILANGITCLQRFGKVPNKYSFDISTLHNGRCDYCGKKTEITEVRDFFYPDFELINKVTKLLALNKKQKCLKK